MPSAMMMAAVEPVLRVKMFAGVPQFSTTYGLTPPKP
jgi:hypothetical protein